MNVVDLFCGLKGWSQAFAERGHDVWTTDIDPRFAPSLAYDVRELTPDHIPFDHVDIVLASPPCEGFSVASMGKAWGGGKVKVGPRRWGHAYEPMTPTAKLGMELVIATVALIEELQPTFAVIENPRGALRKLNLIPPDDWENIQVWYCHYGETRAKPTDLWGHPFPMSWVPQPPCVKGARGCGRAKGTDELCHELAPRGARTGTQGLGGYSDRAKVPHALSLAMCEAAEADLKVTVA